MKVLLLPLLEGLLWFLRLLPKKPQPSQVRDTQPESEAEPDFEIPRWVPPAPQERFQDISRNAITDHLDRNKRIIDAYERLDAESTYSPAQEWKHIAVPRHKRDLDLVNYLKRTGKI